MTTPGVVFEDLSDNPIGGADALKALGPAEVFILVLPFSLVGAKVAPQQVSTMGGAVCLSKLSVEALDKDVGDLLAINVGSVGLPKP